MKYPRQPESNMQARRIVDILRFFWIYAFHEENGISALVKLNELLVVLEDLHVLEVVFKLKANCPVLLVVGLVDLDLQYIFARRAEFWSRLWSAFPGTNSVLCPKHFSLDWKLQCWPLSGLTGPFLLDFFIFFSILISLIHRFLV
jgi:hypothetical protein